LAALRSQRRCAWRPRGPGGRPIKTRWEDSQPCCSRAADFVLPLSSLSFFDEALGTSFPNGGEPIAQAEPSTLVKLNGGTTLGIYSMRGKESAHAEAEISGEFGGAQLQGTRSVTRKTQLTSRAHESEFGQTWLRLAGGDRLSVGVRRERGALVGWFEGELGRLRINRPSARFSLLFFFSIFFSISSLKYLNQIQFPFQISNSLQIQVSTFPNFHHIPNENITYIIYFNIIFLITHLFMG
jgi:hypothetical protein